MKKFEVTERVPSFQFYTYIIEAESEDKVREIMSTQILTPIYEATVEADYREEHIKSIVEI
jgi:hypothetical protein